MKTQTQLLVTMGDVAGIGPEIIARAWPDLTAICRPIVVGDRLWLERAIDLSKISAGVQPIDELARQTHGPI